MGNKVTVTGLSEAMLEDYESLTFLTRNEILYLLRKFLTIDPEAMSRDFHHRIHKNQIMERFPPLRFNPFRDRLFSVFSSRRDDKMSFEDFLDLCSVMSDQCPLDVKAAWAFRVFDINEDMSINMEDISNIIDRLVWDYENADRGFSVEEKEKIAKTLLQEMKLVKSEDGVGAAEFKHCMSKIPEFANAFYFRL